jgi:hypothetical protein
VATQTKKNEKARPQQSVLDKLLGNPLACGGKKCGPGCPACAGKEDDLAALSQVMDQLNELKSPLDEKDADDSASEEEEAAKTEKKRRKKKRRKKDNNSDDEQFEEELSQFVQRIESMAVPSERLVPNVDEAWVERLRTKNKLDQAKSSADQPAEPAKEAAVAAPVQEPEKPKKKKKGKR